MEVSDLILADYAAANDRGKFTLVGAGITEISTSGLPCIHPLIFLMVRLKITRMDQGKNRVEIRIVGEKGAIFKAEGDVDVSPDHQDEQHCPLPFPLANLKFDQAGDYSIEVRINGDLKQSQNLRIKKIEQPAIN